MNKLYAFGDSFTFGSDLSDCNNNDIKHSNSTWTALLAKDKSLNYICHAYPGISNQSIVRKFFDNLQLIDKNDFVVINWTWTNRWDFYNINETKWESVRPNSTNSIFYKNYIKYFQSELWDKLETLKAINLLQAILKNNNIKFIMTCVDDLAFDTKWHCPTYIENLQNNAIQDIIWFNNLGFYNWAKENKYEISNNWHPLEEAHKRAFKYIIDNYDFT
jgi:hypothetical protein